VDLPLILIIGGGPAGLFCALQSAGRNRRVLLIEKNATCGRKLMITGSGQCNLTHDGKVSEFFGHYGEHDHFLRPVLLGYTNLDLIGFFEERGLPMDIEPGGKVFPATRKASDVLGVLMSECSQRKVEIICGHPVSRITSRGDGFSVETAISSHRADTVVIATGGASYPFTGSTGDGYDLARRLGHTITGITPALTPIRVRDHPFSDLAGISFQDLPISLFRNEKKIRQHIGDLLITHTGLSGPGILNLSRYIVPGDVLKVSFFPGMDQEDIRKMVTVAIALSGTRRIRTVLTGLSLPERFVSRLLDQIGIPPDLTCPHITRQARNEIISAITGFPFTVLGLGDFEEAMVTRGGIDLREIDPKTMESKIVPGLYAVGEVLDIDGDTGGYNLQAAFSTGMLAARSIVRDYTRTD
jgi:predicted Rossmann fold flavoprotein